MTQHERNLVEEMSRNAQEANRIRGRLRDRRGKDAKDHARLQHLEKEQHRLRQDLGRLHTSFLIGAGPDAAER